MLNLSTINLTQVLDFGNVSKLKSTMVGKVYRGNQKYTT